MMKALIKISLAMNKILSAWSSPLVCGVWGALWKFKRLVSLKTLMGPTRENLVLHPLATLRFNNWLNLSVQCPKSSQEIEWHLNTLEFLNFQIFWTKLSGIQIIQVFKFLFRSSVWIKQGTFVSVPCQKLFFNSLIYLT